MTAIEAFKLLPGSEFITDDESIKLCLEYFIAPQHFHVVRLAVGVLIESSPSISNTDLALVVKEGILGTTRRFILAAQGLPVSGGPGGHLFSFSNIEEIKLKIVQKCR
jgi:hypothetical protein